MSASGTLRVLRAQRADELETAAQRRANRLWNLAALLLSSLLSLGFMGVLSLMVSPKRANP